MRQRDHVSPRRSLICDNDWLNVHYPAYYTATSEINGYCFSFFGLLAFIKADGNMRILYNTNVLYKLILRFIYLFQLWSDRSALSPFLD